MFHIIVDVLFYTIFSPATFSYIYRYIWNVSYIFWYFFDTIFSSATFLVMLYALKFLTNAWFHS